MYEENAEENDAAIFTEIPNFSFPEADNLLKENEALKLQLHEQDNEISNLTAQLKFSNSVTENKKKNKSSKKMSETDRMEKFFNKTYNSKIVKFLFNKIGEGEEETFETLHNISKYDEIYLMLRAQASSLELLLNDIQ